MNHSSLHLLALLALVGACSHDESAATTTSTAGELTGTATLGELQPARIGAVPGVQITATPGAIYGTYREGTGLVVIRSTNGGADWEVLSRIGGPNGTNGVVVAAPGNSNVLYLTHREGYSWGYGVFPGDPPLLMRSDDGGRTWSDRTMTVPSVGEGRGFDTLDINPSDDQHLVAVNCGGVQKSLDGGKSWAVLPGTSTFASGSCNGANLYRGVDDRKTIYALYDVGEGGASLLMRTTDDGVTWTTAKQATDTTYLVGSSSLVIDPHDARHIFRTDISTFYSSADGGDTFFHHSRGLPESPSSVAVEPVTQSLFIGRGDSIYRWTPANEPEGGHWITVASQPNAKFSTPIVAGDHLLAISGERIRYASIVK